MIMTNDQKQIVDAITERPELATLLNRLVFRGVDPECLRIACPDEFRVCCKLLGIDPFDGAEVIRQAHISGPARIPAGSPGELLWLFLARYSVEESALDSTSDTLSFLHNSLDIIDSFQHFIQDGTSESISAIAEKYKEVILRLQPIGWIKKDIPIYNSDIGFYVAYRSGYHAAAVTKPTGTFYGTDGSCTLKDLGIQVEKEISPYFGIIFGITN